MILKPWKMKTSSTYEQEGEKTLTEKSNTKDTKVREASNSKQISQLGPQGKKVHSYNVNVFK